ncbi:Hsp70 family protein [Nocardia thailandica]|uniref:Hsp70 family protein n=1 Tax=Nocardia thailandica TaxID=257275 RepID=A0ABW6PRD5_9NOCA
MNERLTLGITVGTVHSVAVATEGDSAPVAVVERRSAVQLSPDAAPALALSAQRPGRHARAVVLEDFLSRVGDPVGIIAEDGSTHSAADLVATTTSLLIDEIHALTGDYLDEATIVACHPAWWPEATVQEQRDAFDRAGIGAVTLVPEPLAVVRRYEIERGLLDQGALVVYDLGAGGLTVSVVRTGDQAGLLGSPAYSPQVSGAEFDLLTMRYVLANAVGDAEFDPFDPEVERELAELRDRCRKAKEDLSINTATGVSVGALGAGSGIDQVRIVRGELEDLLRGDIADSLDLVRAAVHGAGMEFGDIAAVLLTGGGGAIPLVAEMVSAEFGVPVVACDNPRTASAAGAAELAADLQAAQAPDNPSFLPGEPGVAAAAPAAATPTRELPALPAAAPQAKRLLTAKRAVLLAAAVVALGGLATGTLAVSTGTPTPSTPTPSSVAPGAAKTGAEVPGAGTIAGQPVLDATGNPVPGTQAPGSAAAGAPGTATAPGTQAPGTQAPGTQGAPANPQTAGAPAGQSAPAGGQQAPAQQQAPAPQEQAPVQQAPAPQSPAPQSPAPGSGPVTQTVPVPQVPRPTVPGQDVVPNVVGGATDTLGGVVDGVTGLVPGAGN